MRLIRFAFLAVLGVALITVSLANRQLVPLRLYPAPLEEVAGAAPGLSLPLFLVILGAIAFGVMIGFFWEWMREGAQRAEAARNAREMARLRREVKRLKGEKHEGKDEVLALLDEAS